MAQVSALFREINSAEPVRMIDLIEHETTDSQNDCVELTSPMETSSSNSTTTVQNDEPSTPIIKATNQIEPDLTQPDKIALLTETIESLAKLKPEMFKPSSRCKPPHLNIDVMRDDLFQSNFLQRHSIATSTDLLLKLSELNQQQKSIITSQSGNIREAASKSMQLAIQKATEYDFFLGLEKTWMYK